MLERVKSVVVEDRRIYQVSLKYERTQRGTEKCPDCGQARRKYHTRTTEVRVNGHSLPLSTGLATELIEQLLPSLDYDCETCQKAHDRIRANELRYDDSW